MDEYDEQDEEMQDLVSQVQLMAMVFLAASKEDYVHIALYNQLGLYIGHLVMLGAHPTEVLVYQTEANQWNSTLVGMAMTDPDGFRLPQELKSWIETQTIWIMEAMKELMLEELK